MISVPSSPDHAWATSSGSVVSPKVAGTLRRKEGTLSIMVDGATADRGELDYNGFATLIEDLVGTGSATRTSLTR